ncbi:RNA-binding protein spenito-like [Lineus longissimus]|uniref:RNA-binding protein spenito-like n=1 Tax=Lineus longissimus TaxID=88925 RepID=UPI002B4F4442
MKRNPEGDLSPRSKRTRAGYGGRDDSLRDRLSPDIGDRQPRMLGREKMRMRDSRDRDYDFEPDRLPPKRHREEPRPIDDFDPSPRMQDRGPERPDIPRGERGEVDYRSLCISGVSVQASDTEVRDALYREFRKFGEFNVKVVHNGQNRLAYVNFRFPDDAKEARFGRGKLMLFDKPVRVEPVYNKNRNRSITPPRPMPAGPPFDSFSSRSNSPPLRRSIPRHELPPIPRRDPRDFPPEFDDNPPGRPGPDHEVHQMGNAPKFPHHLDHIMPEDDDKATRTLFVGNLDVATEQAEIRQVFDKFGIIEDIDIKRPARGQGNAYAFIKFLNLDMAHRAKVAVSGEFIGKFQCKIGYGKVTPTTALWVGGLGPWIRQENLEREFDRFGVINRIEWPHGKSYAYVLYDSIDAASAACKEMRGFPLGGPDRRLRVDFAEPDSIPGPRGRDGSGPRDSGSGGDSREFRGGGAGGPPPRHFEPEGLPPPMMREQPPPPGFEPSWPGPGGPNYNQGYMDRPPKRDRRDSRGEGDHYRNPDNPREFNNYGRPPIDDLDRDFHRGRRSPDVEPPRFRRMSPDLERTFREREQRFPSPRRRRSFSGEPGRHSIENDVRRSKMSEKNGASNSKRTSCSNLSDLAKCLPIVWNGVLILKSSAFPTRLHLVKGDVNLVDSLMKDPTTETTALRITQRLRLLQPKLDDLNQKVTAAGLSNSCVFLAMPGSTQPLDDPTNSIQQRPLRNLVSYLKQKDSAGVISLPPTPTKDKENVGVLHAFPPCQFGHDFLQDCAPNLGPDPAKDDHLVVMVVKGPP